MDSKIDTIKVIIDNIYNSIGKIKPNFSRAELEQLLNEWTFENVIRLEFYMRRKTKFGIYIAEEGLEVLWAFDFICGGGGNPEMDESDKANSSDDYSTISHDHEEGSFLSVTLYRKNETYITGEIKSRKIVEINQSIASKFKIDAINIPYPLVCFEKWTMTDLHNSGIYVFNPLGFYQDLNDEIDGTNLRRGEAREFYVLAWETEPIYSIIKQLNTVIQYANYSEIEKSKITKIEEFLSKHIHESSIVKFSLFFDA
jgi:hypothetical protein